MKLFNRVSPRICGRGRKRPVNLSFELVEDRVLLATFTVNSAADTQGVPGSLTLRDAIIASNTNPLSETNLIKFAIGTGAQTITLLQPLPPVTQPVIIDGTSQGGYAGKPLITLTPGAAFPGDALDVYAGFTQIRGLNIQGFKGNGIVLAANGSDQVQDCYIGTSLAGTSAAPNTGNGVLVSGSSTNTITNDIVSGNGGDGIQIADNNTTLFLGQNYVWKVPPNTTVTGGNTSYTPYSIPLMLSGQGYTFTLPATPAPLVSLTFSADGALTGSCALPTINATLTGPGGPSTVTIAGTPPGSPAIVSGTWDPTSGKVNGSFAIQEPVTGVGTNGEFSYFGVVGGKVSLDSTLSGTYQVSQGDPFGRITFLAKGISDVVNNAEQNSISGNYIGTNASGANLGNTGNGVNITDASNSTIGGTATGAGNVIAFNTGAAVTVDTGTGNAIRQNSIFANGQGIVLVNGGNADQPAPIVLAVASVPNLTTIDYQVTGTVGQAYTIDFFASSTLGSPAAQFLGSVTTAALLASPQSFTTTISLSTPLSSGQTVTATATSPGNNTSEFATSTSLALPYQVTNTTDNVPGSEVGSLRQVILNADTSPPPPGTNITFNIPVGPFVISPTTPLPAIAVPVTIDGTSQTGFPGTPIIQINGSGLAGAGLTLGTGSSGSTVKGMDIYNFSGAGILIQTNNNLIEGDYLGTGVSGTAAGPGNQIGIDIVNGANNIIGGTGAGAGNVISGNSGDGIDVSSDGNFVQGNKIGTNAAGTAALGNGTTVGSGGAGVRLGGSSNMIANNVISGNVSEGIFINVGGNMVLDNFIGTNAAGTAALGNGLSGITLQQSAGNLIRGNTISGNGVSPLGGNGIDLAGSGSQNNVIEANLIGTDSAGTLSLPNLSDGVFVTGPNNTIGGTGAGAGNVISGNHLQGLEINGVTAGGNQVLGNFIGTNAAGTTALGNGLSGISLEQTAGNVIRGNIVSGNGVTFGSGGIDLTGSGSQGNLIQANLVGTNASGTQALPNIGDGVSLAGPDNTIGGTGSGAGNVISGNTGDGIALNSGASDISIVGNLIGTDVTGKQALGNHIDGIFVSNSPSNTIGGTTAAARNVISGNQRFGIWIFGALSTGNLVQGNFIGTDVTGTLARGNSGNGVQISSGATNNTIGGTGPGEGNLISGNGSHGISISTGTDNLIEGNKIGVNAGGMGAIGNDLDGIQLSNSAGNTISGNLVSGNGINQDAAGINLESNDRNNIIAGNEIGTDVSGNKALGNSLHGIFLGNGSSNNTIGGPTVNDRNVISGNGQFPVANLATQGSVGVYIYGANTSGNVVQGNYIGTDAAGNDALTNSVIGVLISQSSGNTVQGNLISGNRLVGLEIAGGAGGTASGNLLQGNLIGTDAGGTRAVPNGLDGIFISDAPNNSIGGTTAGAGNLISGNGSVGIQLFGPLTRGNVVQGNALGLNSAGRPTLPNRMGGIFVNTGPLNNKIGGTAPGQANRGQSRPLYTVSGSQQSDPGSTAQTATAAGRRFRIRGRARTSLRAHSTAH